MNESIERELKEFMDENEEKFGKSKMNQKFQFPRKIHNIEPIKFDKEMFIRRNTPGSASIKSNRRYKSQENQHKYLIKDKNSIKNPNGNIVLGDSGSTQPLRKNYKILQNTLNLSNTLRQNNFKLNLNNSIYKKGIKKIGRKSSTKKKRFLTEVTQSKSTLKKIKSTERGIQLKRKDLKMSNSKQKKHYDTMDLTINSILNQKSINRLSAADNKSLGNTVILKGNKTRKNKTPVGRYGRKTNDEKNHSQIKLNNVYRNQVPMYMLTDNQSSIDQSVVNSNTQLSSPKNKLF